MAALRTSIFVAWAVFWIYWLVAAAGVKEGAPTRRNVRPVGILIILLGGLTLRIFKANSLSVSSPVLEAAGVIVFLSGLGLAVGHAFTWAATGGCR